MFLIPFKKYKLTSSFQLSDYYIAFEKNIELVAAGKNNLDSKKSFEGKKIENGFDVRRIQRSGMYSFSPKTTIKIEENNNGTQIYVKSHFKLLINLFLLLITAIIATTVFYPIAPTATETGIEPKDIVVLVTPYILSLLLFSFENIQLKTFLTEVVEKTNLHEENEIT